MISILNAIIAGVGNILEAFISILPNSPFNFVYSIDSELLKAICWIFPVPSMIAHLEIYLSAVIVFYGLRIVLNWLKVTSN